MCSCMSLFFLVSLNVKKETHILGRITYCVALSVNSPSTRRKRQDDTVVPGQARGSVVRGDRKLCPISLYCETLTVAAPTYGQ